MKEIEDFYRVDLKYISELYALQVELLKLQKYISEQGLRLAILFEGRDTAGKGRAISRFTQFLNPQLYRMVALGKPSEQEKGQWYFQRYIKELPNAGEIVFFDRSWYNRAVVEPVMGFCTTAQYERFMKQVNPFEQMLVEDGIILVKFWFSIKMDEQKERIQRRLESPLMQWKVSPVDLAAQEKWESFTIHKEKMFNHTNTDNSPWMIVRGKSREEGRLQAMQYLLSLFDYGGKEIDLSKQDSVSVWRWK